MREATRHGKLTREKLAELMADDSDDFIEWAAEGDEDLLARVEAVREERRVGALF